MTINKYIKKIKKDGYCVIKNFLTKVKVEQTKLLVLKNFDKTKKFKGLPKRNSHAGVVYNLQNKNLHFIRLLQKPIIVNICKYFLNDVHFRVLPKRMPNYTLNQYNARSSGGTLDLHIDSLMPYLGEHIYMLQCVIILEDQNKINGCTYIVPKSHLSGMYSNRKTKYKKDILTKSGDLVIWDSRLWHGTNANLSGKSRWSLIASFSRWWVKQSMDMTRSIPHEFFKKLSINEKIMLGFCSVIPLNENRIIRTKRKISEIKFKN